MTPYPGSINSGSHYPEGITSHSPGFAEPKRSYPGEWRPTPSTLKGLRQSSIPQILLVPFDAVLGQ